MLFVNKINFFQNHYKQFDIDGAFKSGDTLCRFIIRDFCGKYCWDCCALNSSYKNYLRTYTLGNVGF